MLHHANAEARVARWETLGARREGNSEETITTGATDLSDLVSAIVNAARDLTLEPTRSPWLEPLPELLTLDPEWSPPQSASSLSAVFGVEDRPEVQSQVPAYFDIERDGHLLVVGDAGSGRSTFLRTLAASIASRCSARDVHLFGIDCGNGALLPLADLPQCGAVVSRTEIERVDRLITRLLAEVAQRQQNLSLGGFSSIVDQRAQATPEDRLPYIVVLLDRWEGFVSEFDVLDAGRLVSSFLHLMKEAPGVGVRVVVAGDRTALSARFAALVESTIALRLNDRSNYSMVGLNSRKLPEQIVPGRGFRGGSGTEIQIALLDEDPSGPAQAAALRAIARETVARDSALEPADLPAPIASLPQILPLSTVLTRPARTDQSLQVLVGVGGDRAEAQWVDLAMYGPGFIIGGPPRSGRSNALLVVARSLLAQDQQILVVTGRTSSLSLLENNPGVMAVMDGRSVTSETLSGVIASSGGPLAVLVDDAELLADAPIAETLSTFVRTARDYGNALILAGATAELASGFRGFAPEARKSKSGLLLCPSSPTDGELVGVRLSRASVFPGPPGRGLLATQAGTMLVQVPIDNLGF
jgi:S-DNA-T family DNA segregation ATPase FtsK/SpoIIIE